MSSPYIFISARLGFRNWKATDLDEFAKMNADQDVMEYFPKTLSKEETAEFIVRLQLHYEKYNYNYFAVELLESEEFIGFIGLADQDYESAFTPAMDIGWRLKKSAWGQGYATEGAKRCLEYAFDTLKMAKIVSICTEQNLKSEQVMQKIGMTKKGHFLHPKLQDFPEMEKCIWYEISANKI